MPARFILIDPSIRDFAGHHYRYADCVLRAACAAGLQAQLATNRQFASEAQVPWPVHRLYAHGYWDRPAWLSCPPWCADWARRAAAHLCRSGSPDLAPPEAVRPVRLWPADWLRSAATCLWDWRARQIERFRLGHFVRDTLCLVQRLQLGPHDVCFLPTAGVVELQGLLDVFEQDEQARSARWHLLFRREPPTCGEGAGSQCQPAKLFASFRGHGAAARVHLYTDTEELSRQWESVAGVSFCTLPIPHTEAPASDGCRPGQPLRVLYLGDARKEKGYHHLPWIVRAMWRDCIAAGRAVFVIQSNPSPGHEEPEVRAARQSLASCQGPGLLLLGGGLDCQQYRTVLVSGDVVLLPYDARAYAARSSGILAEALAAGIPPVVPAGTWLARQFPAFSTDGPCNSVRPGSSREAPVGATYADIHEVPALIRQVLDRHSQLRQAAKAFAARWIKWHNPEKLLELLLAVD